MNADPARSIASFIFERRFALRPLTSRILPPILTFLGKGSKEAAKKAPELVVAALEPRVVPAVNVGPGLASGSLSTAQIHTLVSGLEGLDLVLHDVDGRTEFATFAGLEKGAGELFGLGSADGKGGFLGDAFRDQFDAAFSSQSSTTVADVNAFLQAGPGNSATGSYTGVSWQFLQGGTYTGAHPLEWEVKISGAQAKAVAAKLDGPETFETAPTAQVTATGSATFSFGLDAAGNFFATLGDTHVQLVGTQSSPSGKIDFGGGKKFDVTGGSLAVDSTLGVALHSPEAADGILTGVELGSLHTANTPGARVNQTGPGLSASYRLNTTTPILLVQKATAPGGSTAERGYDMVLTAGLSQAYGNLFDKLQDAGAKLEESPIYTTQLPGLSGSIKTLTPVGDVFALAQEAHDYLTLNGPKLSGLAEALTAALPASLKASFSTDFDPTAETLSLSLNLLSGAIHSQVDFDRFGEAAGAVGLSFDQGIEVQFSSGFLRLA